MIIGFDAKRANANFTGLGNYSRFMVDTMATYGNEHKYRMYIPKRCKHASYDSLLKHKNVASILPRTFLMKSCKALWRTFFIKRGLLQDGVQLYHGLSNELPIGLHRTGIRSVVTIHDLIFLRYPQYYHWLDRKIYNDKFRYACRKANRIVAVSECTKRDVMLYGDVPADKIDVIYQSCGSFYKLPESEKKMHEVHTKYMLPERYVVSVGTVDERKNVLLPIKALRLLPDDLSLVVVGKSTPYAERLKKYVAANGLKDRVMFLHNVPTDDLPAIYQMAESCVYPSRYEGFGLPVIEAIQSGLPVVACTGSCLEEAGGNATLYVAPDDAYAMAHAIKLTLKGAPGRDERIAEGLQYISRFENNNVAQRVLEVYNGLAGNL